MAANDVGVMSQVTLYVGISHDQSRASAPEPRQEVPTGQLSLVAHGGSVVCGE